MARHPSDPPSTRVVDRDAPDGLVVAWRHETAIGEARDRRGLAPLLVVGAALLLFPLVALIGFGVTVVAAAGAVVVLAPERLQARQEREGWAVGAPPGELSDVAQCAVPDVAPEALATLVQDLAIHDARWARWQQDALLRAPSAAPPPGSGIRPLSEVIRPHCTTDMRVAHARGRALAELLGSAPDDVAVILDLPGPEAVAVAAALAGRYQPIWTMETWPHPRGVVPAHLTLGAVLYWRDALRTAATVRPPGGPPMFVLDDLRAGTSHPEFDNRYAVDLPGGSEWKALGIRRILYVRGRSSDGASADLAAGFSEAHWRNDVPVLLVALQDLQPIQVPELPADPGGMTYWWGGSPETHWHFPVAYGLPDPGRPARPPPVVGIPWTPAQPRPAPRPRRR